MTTFETPTVTTGRLRLCAFRQSDLDAYSAMQANPEVMRYMVMGRTSTPSEVWRTMLMSIGSWALRGYGMWTCERVDDEVFIGSVGVFIRSTGRNPKSPTRSISPSEARALRPRR